MANTVKITKKDYFTKVINLLNGALDFGFDPDEDVDAIIAFCEKEIATLDKRSAKAKETAAAKREAADELYEAVAAVLPVDFTTIDEITAMVDFPEVTRNKVSNRLSKLAVAGVAEKGEISVTGADGKSKKVVAYKAID
jgi:hypothetical protein